jgi:pantoate--beta-alanine ligase
MQRKFLWAIFLVWSMLMNKPLILTSVAEFDSFRKSISDSVGLVTTMGALHEGHAALLKRSVDENEVTVLTIFVNPTQFNDKTDLEKYPRTFESDYAIADASHVDVIFKPDDNEIYADNYQYRVAEHGFSNMLCGMHRKGHFEGVLTVLMKLFNIIKPHRAYYGEKDFQQLRLIDLMTKAFFMPIDICSVKTVREPSGLAMSSRNTRLSPEGREKAALIYQFMRELSSVIDIRHQLSQEGFMVDYVEDVDGRRFVAVFLEGIRLIDNMELS